jgi:hypothetical protein
MSDDPWQKDRKPQKNTLIDSLIPNLDAVLGVRDLIGAKIRDVFFMTRIWSTKIVGEGEYNDVLVQMLPTPQIKDYSHSIMLHEAGAVRSGDIILKNISKHSYPLEKDVDCRVDQSKLYIQKFYFINNLIYNVIHVKDGYVTWDVQIRKIDDERSKVAASG